MRVCKATNLYAGMGTDKSESNGSPRQPIVQQQKPIFDQMLDGMLVDAIDAITR